MQWRLSRGIDYYSPPQHNTADVGVNKLFLGGYKMISYNTDLVQGVMKVLDDAGLLDLPVPEIIKLVEEKFTSTNTASAPPTPCPLCGSQREWVTYPRCSCPGVSRAAHVA